MEAVRQQIAAMRQSFFDEELLDKYFIQLEKLEEMSNPSFVEDVVTLYFRDSTKLLANIEEDMEKTPVDYMKLDRCFHQLKGSSASIGANKVRNEVNKAREFCRAGNMEAAKASFQQLKVEHSTLKAKLQAYFQLLAEVVESD
ncbi:Histidine phosphotransfer protein [Melia azedarach]|uniref:Histidine phosphotransfer protein n=1 Tax=Melia azedarach TaxID=155640 RepID=A0ACC1XBF8_MELAZ|nr:Histidine phosphotransfer protein [Melia azedarach]